MLGQDLIVTATEGRPPALIEGSGRKARTQRALPARRHRQRQYQGAFGRSLGSFFAFLEDGGRARVQDIDPLDVRDYLEAAKANGPSTATLKQHMPAIRMLLNHLVTGGDTVTGLRDRALIGVMVLTFARVSAACCMKVADIFHQRRRLWVRLPEKKVASSTRCLPPHVGGLSGGIP